MEHFEASVSLILFLSNIIWNVLVALLLRTIRKSGLRRKRKTAPKNTVSAYYVMFFRFDYG